MVFVHLPATIYASIILQTYLKRPPLFHKKLTNQLTAISHLFTCVDLLCLVTFLTRHPTTPNELAFTVLCDSSQLCPIPMPTTHNITRPYRRHHCYCYHFFPPFFSSFLLCTAFQKPYGSKKVTL